MSDIFGSMITTDHHKTGPEQDHRARLVVVDTLRKQNHGIRAMAEVLDMLALLPGQESKRNTATANLKSIPQEQECGPKKNTTKASSPS